MELRHLRYFVAAAEEGNFHRAAERLHIVQPALSRQIATLERELGVVLFARERQRVRLTAAGQTYLGDVRRLLKELSAAGARAERAAKGEVGLLRIGFHETAGRSRLVADYIRRFRLRHPDIELQLSQLTSPRQVEAITQGDLDAGFIYMLQTLPPDFGHRHLATDTFHVALRKDHRLAKARRIRPADLAAETFVWIARSVNPFYYDALIAACSRAKLVPSIVQETQNEATTMNLVAAGMGIAILLSNSGESWFPDVLMLPITGLDLDMPLALTWKTSAVEPTTQHFIDELDE
jgi:DNA-binding transcriptional LysR family regulator